MSNGHNIVADWFTAERDFEVNRYDGRLPSPIEVIKGSARPWLVLTAPHAVNHWRNGVLKVADRGTGGLVRILSRNLSCAAVINARQAYSDPAYDYEHAFKDALEEFKSRAVLVDFHGMIDQRGLDVEIGLGLFPTDASKRIARHLGSKLERSRLRVAYNEKYVSPNPGSITNWALVRNLPAIQVEIAARVRPPLGSEQACAIILATLQDALAVGSPTALWHLVGTDRLATSVRPA